ncbi:MAG: sialidase family protein, partial [Phycisphaerae bacterium]|nr:sialidase family protein [Phycisphaerae bacterium]
ARRGIAPGVRDSEFAGRRKWGLGRLNFAVDPLDTNRVIVTGMSDLFVSGDAGKTWKQMYNDDIGPIDKGSRDFFCKTRGLTMTSAWQYRFDPHDRKYRYICYTDFGFLRSIDGGRTWAASPPANSCYAIQFVPGARRIIGAASSVHDIPGWGFTYNKHYRGGRVVYSDDRGDTWKTLGEGFPDIPCTYVELDKFRSKKNRLVLWATFYGNKGGGLYRSDDSGAEWRKVKGLGIPGNDHFLEVKVHPKTGDIYVAVTGTRNVGSKAFKTGGFWCSKDDGRTWTNIAKSLDLRWQARFCLDPGRPGTVYLAASTPPWHRQGGVYKTSGNGSNWKRILDVKTTSKVPYTSSGILQMLSVDIHPNKPNIVYACTKTHGLWCSQDAGKTWAFMKVPHFRPGHVTVDPENDEIIYVSTFGGGTWKGYYLP